uniref:Uncharacterized protein n=1 Tax=Hanusia phi TaxID=3032 RepID=A0A7S0E9B7_9CRYP|eukprot:749790-Hanusia_phi.AAC.2
MESRERRFSVESAAKKCRSCSSSLPFRTQSAPTLRHYPMIPDSRMGDMSAEGTISIPSPSPPSIPMDKIKSPPLKSAQNFFENFMSRPGSNCSLPPGDFVI